MEKIIVYVDWCDRNFGASFGDNVPGGVAFTASSFENLKKEARDTLLFHVEGMVDDGDSVPQWLRNGEFEFVYKFVSMAALLRSVEDYASLSAISRVTGINACQLSHYANGIKKPRQAQRQRIIDGIHEIGRRLSAV